VTHFLHPELRWETCLSAGTAISAVCAILEGRSIGTISSPDSTESKKKTAEDATAILESMHFKLKHKNGIVFLGSGDGEAQSGSETALRGKFGARFEDVQRILEESLERWRDGEKLNEEAFGMYEGFRPGVSKGQTGW